ncbi:MAG TPA: HipA family kinase [Candidatus Angelobacter sp.]|jgi:hypothetical protein|nr:HipA family kinase [Candidatus Angelobacter sp.]
MIPFLHAEQHIRKMRGRSQAHLIRASNGAFYVVKFQNPYSPRILANEMLATQIGLWLGLPLPTIDPIEVSAWLIQNTPELRVQVDGAEYPCRSGLHLGSRYPFHPVHERAEIYDHLPESQLTKLADPLSFARVMVLDKWLGNTDGRQAIFVRKRRARLFNALFIDHESCFDAGRWAFPDLPFHGVYHQNYVYEQVTGWKSFEPALTKAETASFIDLWRFGQMIPPEWYGQDSDGLRQLVETVYERWRRIRHLIEAFRRSEGNPFPNWKDATPIPPDEIDLEENQ